MKAVEKKKRHIPKNEETGLAGMCQRIEVKKNQKGGRSQDGGGIGRGDHFLFYKFIERTTER